MTTSISNPETDSYFDLGSYTRRITTSKAEAQIWFDRGLVWTYAFNHEEATACFQHAIEADPEALFAYWGVAYTVGPNYNKPWEMFDADEEKRNLAQAMQAIETAKSKAKTSKSTEVELTLIDAIAYRYSFDTDEDRATWNENYASAMEKVYHSFSSDLDVAALYADALMNLTPWSLWNLRTGEPAKGARTIEAKSVLDNALAQPSGTTHPGLLHLYIHLMEMSSTPELALPSADALRDLVPDGGHLQHMPTHIDVLCGDYRRVVSSNTAAIHADERWVSRAGALNFYTLYRCHNYHFRIYGAMFAGQYAVALETVGELEKAVPLDLLRVESPPMADWLEGFLSMRMHVLIRFGRWEDILALQLPSDSKLLCTTTAMTHYAKGVAYAALNRIAEAEKEQTLFHSAQTRVPASRTLFNNTCTDILRIAASMLAGEILHRKFPNGEEGFTHLRRAVEQSDNLPYDEPWGWMQPPRHAYGALLLERGRVEEAAAVYAADLGLDETLPRALQHPNNVWALQGLWECLVRLGREGKARIVKKSLDLVKATADVRIESSCFCRREN